MEGEPVGDGQVCDILATLFQALAHMFWPFEGVDATPLRTKRQIVGPFAEQGQSDIDLDILVLLYKNNDTEVSATYATLPLETNFSLKG